MKIVEFIQGLEGADTLGYLNRKNIEEAEKELGVIFSRDYEDYLENFRYLAWGELELTGLVKQEDYNVVHITQDYRKRYGLARMAYVVEVLEGACFTSQLRDGRVFSHQGDQEPVEIHRSLVDYLRSRMGDS